MKKILSLLIIVAVALMTVVTAHAVTVTLPQNLYDSDGYLWDFYDWGSGWGLGVGNGTYDSYDLGATIRVGGTVFNPGNTADLTGSTITSSTVNMGGLDVVYEAFVDTDTPTARSLVSFTNTTGSNINTTISYQTNVGADSGNQIINTSNGDTSFTTADRWITTDDSGDAGGGTSNDPTLNHILYGPGSPLLTPSFASMTVFDAAGNQGVRSDYSILVGAGETLSLLFFNQQRPNRSTAAADVLLFNNVAAMETAGLFDGLSNAELSQVVNWDLGEPVPEPTTMLLLGSGLIGLAGFRRKFRKS
ncbi:PEP-CTERM sorting domain-containing protein [Thermodesulfobacteriota bacterium]